MSIKIFPGVINTRPGVNNARFPGVINAQKVNNARKSVAWGLSTATIYTSAKFCGTSEASVVIARVYISSEKKNTQVISLFTWPIQYPALSHRLKQNKY